MRHGNTGAIAMRKSNVNPMGMVMRLKYGTPTDTRSSFNASTASGNNVPNKMTKAKAANRTLFAKNAPSRDSGESIRPGDRSRSPLQPMSPTVEKTMSAKKLMRAIPILDVVNACTDSSTPERVIHVPRIVRANVAHNSEMFHTRNMPRRSCTKTECKYAVPVSHGSNDAFSTGSQAQ